jgi:hypothetical protein
VQALPCAAAAALVALAAAGCRAPDPHAEVTLSDVEAYWAVDRPAGETQFIAPVVRFRVRNQGRRPLRSIQASSTFRIKNDAQAWSGAFQQVAPQAGRALDPGQSTLVVLKPEGEGRYSSTVPPEEMLAHQQFKDVTVEVFLRVGSSGWTSMARADVERRIGARAAAEAR